MSDLALHIVSETNTTITLGWDPPAGCRGYVFNANGKRSSTLDPTRSTVKFAKPGPYTVEALGTLSVGSYPPATPPPPSPPPPPSGRTPAPVVPPSTYTIPSGAVAVSTTAQLLAALAGSATDIVLENGVYDNPSAFNANHKRLYARNLLGATLAAGINFGGNSGPGGGLLQGVIVNVTSTAKAASTNSCVYPWGTDALGFAMKDCRLLGNKVVAYGVNCYSPKGTVWERCEFRDFTDVGLRLSTNNNDGTTIQRVCDIYADGVTRNPVNSSNGTAEAGVWIGHHVTDGVRRIKIRNVSWSGIEPVNACYNTEFSDLDIDMSGVPTGSRVAVYMEHESHGCTFTRCLIVGARVGFAGEWLYGGSVAAKNVLITLSKIIGGTAGVYLDDGSGPGNAIKEVDFVGQTWAAVGAYKNLPNPTVTGCTYSLAAGAVQFSTDHI